MTSSRMRTMMALVLLGCATATLVLPGCSAVKLKHSPAPVGSPHIPEATAARLRECVEELEGEISHGFYDVDAKIKVDEDGRVADVETEGTPNPGVGICMRMALRDMRLPEGFFETGMLRTSSAANGQAMPDRGQIGEVVVITVVTIVFTEVIIEAFALAVGVTVTATVAAGLAEAFAKRRKPVTCRQNLINCLDTDWGGKRGSNPSASLCEACFKLCRDNVWPPTVDMAWGTESCEYPGFKR